MKITTLCLALTLTAATAFGQAIQLRDGALLIGEIQDASGDGLTFRRLDNGGLLELAWSDLTQSSADKVRRLKGLLVEDEKEVTVMADVIEFEVSGGVLQEIVGKIVGESPKTFQIRHKGTTFDIKRETIKNRRKREVPILDVFTRDDYYQEQLSAVDPGSDADKHITLADIMRRGGDLARAEQHLLEAESLGGGRQKTQLSSMLGRVRMLRESEAERGLLARIRHMSNRQQFDKAAELIAEFEQSYPDSKLQSDFEREKRRFAREREKSLIDRIRSSWDRMIHSVATDKVNESKLTLAAAREYAEGEMAEDMFKRVAKNVKIEADEAKQLWQDRNKYTRGRATIFSYGIGSWVLGEEAIIKGSKVEQGQEDKLGGDTDDPELKRIIRMIREQKKRARDLGRKNAGKSDETDEGWWKGLKTAQRRQWLRVYFAEFGGQMEVTRAHATACENCTGQGTTTVLGSTGKPTKEKCTVCQGTRYTRLIRAR